ncbi:hypothetical protein HPG69_004618 [Diceros bicornis minor]|uniref:Pleckstrin homology domain-containing family M member 3 n=1 Tax=Diceros bicornis minor TaxID=77932 RepID=A0A7J7E4C0_DICBM|nr:hypothetical protein HPG69_004618 [Diceros bicornis minor]
MAKEELWWVGSAEVNQRTVWKPPSSSSVLAITVLTSLTEHHEDEEGSERGPARGGAEPALHTSQRGKQWRNKELRSLFFVLLFFTRNYSLVVSPRSEIIPFGKHKQAFPNILKKGYLEIRKDHDSYWQSCYAELSPYSLCVYSLDSSGNQNLHATYQLSHFQSISVLGNLEARLVDTVLYDNTQLQLKAESPWEALDWGQKLWEVMHAAMPDYVGRQDELANSPRLGHHVDCTQHHCLQQKSSELLMLSPILDSPKQYQNILKSGTLYRLTVQNNWKAFTFVLSRACLMAFQPGKLDEDPLLSYNVEVCLAVQMDNLDDCDSCFQVIFPQDVLRLRAETRQRAQEWMEALKTAANAARSSEQNLQVTLRNKPMDLMGGRELRKSKRQSVTTSFLSILTTLSLERGLTAQSFKCAGRCECGCLRLSYKRHSDPKLTINSLGKENVHMCTAHVLYCIGSVPGTKRKEECRSRVPFSRSTASSSWRNEDKTKAKRALGRGKPKAGKSFAVNSSAI